MAKAKKSAAPAVQKLPTSWEDVCKIKGIDPNLLPDVSMIQGEGIRKYTIAAYKLAIIAEVLNEGHVFDWTNYDEYKYYPWFNMDDETAPLGLSFRVYDYDYSFSFVGARLVFKTRQLAKYAGTTFLDVYRNFMVRQ